jgi:hypothetical protein
MLTLSRWRVEPMFRPCWLNVKVTSGVQWFEPLFQVCSITSIPQEGNSWNLHHMFTSLRWCRTYVSTWLGRGHQRYLKVWAIISCLLHNFYTSGRKFMKLAPNVQLIEAMWRTYVLTVLAKGQGHKWSSKVWVMILIKHAHCWAATIFTVWLIWWYNRKLQVAVLKCSPTWKAFIIICIGAICLNNVSFFRKADVLLDLETQFQFKSSNRNRNPKNSHEVS